MTGSVDTVLSVGDDRAGMVILRGHDLARLSTELGYEETAALLWRDFVADTPSRAALGMARSRLFNELTPIEGVASGRPTAQAMHILLSAIPMSDPLDALAGTGLAAVLAMRSAASLPWIMPDPERGQAADLLRMATGTQPRDATAQALERYMILMIDHGISASTYAVRIAASTGAELGGCIAAGLAVLEGGRHGGAPAMVLDQLDEMSGWPDVSAYVAQVRARGGRIVGFGSRAYRGEDVRASLMKREWLGIGGASEKRATAPAIETALADALAGIGKPLRANVEFYAALLLESCGIPRSGLTPMFAAARAAGWIAHVAEQRVTGRMIRPETHYLGPRP